MKRAVVLFPKFNNIDTINNIREKYDPLYNYIAPHITIVFPFESDLTTNELKVSIITCDVIKHDVKLFYTFQ